MRDLELLITNLTSIVESTPNKFILSRSDRSMIEKILGRMQRRHESNLLIIRESEALIVAATAKLEHMRAT